MTANPSFASKPFKKKSALSTMKKTAMLAGGAYLAYKGTILNYSQVTMTLVTASGW